MSKITNRGRAFAAEIKRYFPAPSDTTLELLSLIARHARTHHRLQEISCSVEMTERQQLRHDRRDAQIEARIATLVARLPASTAGKVTVRFEGDPRGYTVKLVVPEQPYEGNTWGRGGMFGI